MGSIEYFVKYVVMIIGAVVLLVPGMLYQYGLQLVYGNCYVSDAYRLRVDNMDEINQYVFCEYDYEMTIFGLWDIVETDQGYVLVQNEYWRDDRRDLRIDLSFMERDNLSLDEWYERYAEMLGEQVDVSDVRILNVLQGVEGDKKLRNIEYRDGANLKNAVLDVTESSVVIKEYVIENSETGYSAYDTYEGCGDISCHNSDADVYNSVIDGY